MNKLIVPIAGMHCRSCEMLIEEKLSEIPAVRKSRVNHKRAIAEVFFTDQKPNRKEIEEAIRAAGYAVGTSKRRTFLSRNANEYKDFGIALLFVVGLFLLFRNSGIADSSGIGDLADPKNISVALLVGLTAGFSTCLALVGGIILGVSSRHAEKHPEATPAQKFRPHLFFNAGRIVSYAVLGGVLGSIGSAFSLSGKTLGTVTIAVGMVMLMLGLKLTKLFPRLEAVGFSLPKGLSRLLGMGRHQKEYSHRNAFMLGMLTFFLPCGFTQAMQLYAVSTGSFIQGSLIMGLFALGTAFGLLGIGGLASAVKGAFARRFFVFSGIVVVILAVFNIGNGLNLAGFSIGAGSESSFDGTSALSADPNVEMRDGVQIVHMTQAGGGYIPDTFTIRVGIPVRWVIDSTSAYTCASSIVLSGYGIQRHLVAGENIIEFTPKKVGQIPFSCSMGMYRGVFNVVGKDS